MIRKPGVQNDIIDGVGAVFVASYKAVHEERLEE